MRVGDGTPGPGRPKGSVNKTTVKAKEAFQLAFDQLGGYTRMVEWAESDPDNLKTFYSLYARLIPTEVAGSKEAPLSIEIIRRVIGANDEA